MSLHDGVFWVACLAAFLVGLSKGGLPAIGMLAVPVLALMISPLRAAALLLPIYILTDVVGVWLYRREHSRANLRILIPAGLLGVLIGWATASWLSDAAVAFLVGAMGIGFCLNAWFGRRPPVGAPGSAPVKPPGRLLGWVCGTLAGFTSFVSHAGGPPYQIFVLPLRLPKAVYAGTTTILFAAINLAKLPPYQLLNPYTLADLRLAAWLAPAALAGVFAGAFVTKRIADRTFFRFVQGALFLVSLQLIYKALVA